MATRQQRRQQLLDSTTVESRRAAFDSMVAAMDNGRTSRDTRACECFDEMTRKASEKMINRLPTDLEGYTRPANAPGVLML